MVQSRTSTKKQLEKYNSKQSANSQPQATNIFELVEKHVPKAIKSFRVSKDYQDNIDLAHAMIDYIKRNHPEQLEAISIEDNVYNGICQLNAELAQILFNNGIKIHFGEGEKLLYFLKDIPVNLNMVFLEAKHLYSLPTQPLRIGFAHLLKHLEGSCSHAFHNATFNNIEDLNNYDEISFFIDMIEEESDSNNVRNSTKRYLRRARKAKRYYDKYLAMDIEEFYSYNPRKEYCQNIQKAIIDLMKVDPNITDTFADSDSDCNGYASFRYFKNVVIDISEELWVDYYFTKSIVDNANCNGWTEPMSYHLYEKGKLIEKTKQEEINEYAHFEAAFDTLRNLL